LDVLLNRTSISACGGGGGRGGSSFCGFPPGGTGGDGGSGGQTGGSSIALFSVNSSLFVESTNLSSAQGGKGGAGADGNPPVEPHFGDGATAGGHGGGGAGGSSVGILLHNSTIVRRVGVTFQLGIPGVGGASSGNAGEDGTTEEILVVK